MCFVKFYLSTDNDIERWNTSVTKKNWKLWEGNVFNSMCLSVSLPFEKGPHMTTTWTCSNLFTFGHHHTLSLFPETSWKVSDWHLTEGSSCYWYVCVLVFCYLLCLQILSNCWPCLFLQIFVVRRSSKDAMALSMRVGGAPVLSTTWYRRTRAALN